VALVTPDERQALRDKHPPCVDCYLCDGVGPLHCNECGLYEYWANWPCDVIKVLDALDEADRRAVSNYERGYDDGYRGSVADAESDNWAGGNDE